MAEATALFVEFRGGELSPKMGSPLAAARGPPHFQTGPGSGAASRGEQSHLNWPLSGSRPLRLVTRTAPCSPVT